MGGLEKFADYNITVLCFTDPGDGEISEFVPVKTKEDGKLEVIAMVAFYILGCDVTNLDDLVTMAFGLIVFQNIPYKDRCTFTCVWTNFENT